MVLVNNAFDLEVVRADLRALKTHSQHPINMTSHAGQTSFQDELAGYIPLVANLSLLNVSGSVDLGGEVGCALYWFIYEWRKQDKGAGGKIAEAVRGAGGGRSKNGAGKVVQSARNIIQSLAMSLGVLTGMLKQRLRDGDPQVALLQAKMGDLGVAQKNHLDHS